MDVHRYLLRIGCSKLLPPTLETLRHIHLSHLLAVPVENLTIHSGGEVKLELQWIYNKIVEQRRGGICYENNGLFSWLLSQLGFEVTILSAQVKSLITGFYGPPFDHFIIMVTLDDHRWLCDVGYGHGIVHPVSLETDSPQKQDHGVFRIRRHGDTLFLETKVYQGDEKESLKHGDIEQSQVGEGCCWTEMYKFTLEPPRHREDFKDMCGYHQSSPSSVFYCKSLCTLLLPHGRVSYIGHKFIITNFPSEIGQQVTKTTKEVSDKEIPDLLKEKFGIVLPSPIAPKDEDPLPPSVIY